MSPMTRSRAKPDGTPGELAAEYYAQRAGVGLIVTEGTQPSDDGQGYLTTPGIYTAAHVAGWKKVTTAVRNKGGRIFIQLMHAGRMSHPDNKPHHRQAVAPSAIAPGSQMFTATGMQDIPRRAHCRPKKSARPLPTSATRRARPLRLAPMASRSTARTAISFSSSSPRTPTRAPTNMAARSRTAPASRSKSPRQLQRKSAPTGRPSACPPDHLWGIDEGAEGPDLYRYLVAQLDKLGLAYIHVMHNGNDS